jgi:hypothetical protein
MLGAVAMVAFAYYVDLPWLGLVGAILAAVGDWLVLKAPSLADFGDAQTRRMIEIAFAILCVFTITATAWIQAHPRGD